MKNPGALAGATGARDFAKSLQAGNFEHSNKAPQRKAGWVTSHGGNGPIRVRLIGRELWALTCLLAAGERGCTPIDTPGPRWSDHVFKLHSHGIDVETITEDHGGAYWGSHARYVLRAKVTIEEATE